MKNEKGDWHWIEKTCGGILPRVPFSENGNMLVQHIRFLFVMQKVVRQYGNDTTYIKLYTK